jgi:hydrogen peroxide-dependent heme synthase
MEGHVPEPTHTLEGWHILHDFRHLDFPRWRKAPPLERQAAWEELLDLLTAWRRVEEGGRGSFGVYQVITRKADLLFLNLRENLDELLELEAALNKSLFAQYLLPAYGFYSVVELGSQEKPLDPESPHVKPRLTPRVPKGGYVCFYPMNKRREGRTTGTCSPPRSGPSSCGPTGRREGSTRAGSSR